MLLRSFSFQYINNSFERMDNKKEVGVEWLKKTCFFLFGVKYNEDRSRVSRVSFIYLIVFTYARKCKEFLVK